MAMNLYNIAHSIKGLRLSGPLHVLDVGLQSACGTMDFETF